MYQGAVGRTLRGVTHFLQSAGGALFLIALGLAYRLTHRHDA
jgi:hypothetical protein